MSHDQQTIHFYLRGFITFVISSLLLLTLAEPGNAASIANVSRIKEKMPLSIAPNESFTLTLFGQNLNKITNAQLLRGKKVILKKAVLQKASTKTNTKRKITLQVPHNINAGAVKIKLFSGRKQVKLPSNTRLTVAPAQKSKKSSAKFIPTPTVKRQTEITTAPKYKTTQTTTKPETHFAKGEIVTQSNKKTTPRNKMSNDKTKLNIRSSNPPTTRKAKKPKINHKVPMTSRFVANKAPSTGAVSNGNANYNNTYVRGIPLSDVNKLRLSITKRSGQKIKGVSVQILGVDKSGIRTKVTVNNINKAAVSSLKNVAGSLKVIGTIDGKVININRKDSKSIIGEMFEIVSLDNNTGNVSSSNSQFSNATRDSNGISNMDVGNNASSNSQFSNATRDSNGISNMDIGNNASSNSQFSSATRDSGGIKKVDIDNGSTSKNQLSKGMDDPSLVSDDYTETEKATLNELGINTEGKTREQVKTEVEYAEKEQWLEGTGVSANQSDEEIQNQLNNKVSKQLTGTDTGSDEGRPNPNDETCVTRECRRSQIQKGIQNTGTRVNPGSGDDANNKNSLDPVLNMDNSPYINPGENQVASDALKKQIQQGDPGTVTNPVP